MTGNNPNRVTLKNKFLSAFRGGIKQVFENLDLIRLQRTAAVDEIKKADRACAQRDLPLRRAGCKLLEAERRESGAAAQHQHGVAPTGQSARNGCLKIDTEPQSDLFIGLHDTAESLTEAIFIEFLTGIGIPESATVGCELISEQQFTVKTAELQFEVHQNHVPVGEKFAKDFIDSSSAELAQPKEAM